MSQGKSSRAVDYLILNLMVTQTIITLKEYDFEHQNNIYGLAPCCTLDILGQKCVFKYRAEHLEVHLLGKSLKGIAHLGESLYRDHGVGSSDHLKIILIVLEDILTVDTSKHDMIDARSTLCPFLSRHVKMIF